MKLKTKVLLITFLFGLPALILGKQIWPPDPGMMPTSSQLPFFIFLSIIEALLFGLGIAFIFLGWSKFSKLKGDARLTFFAITWLLISWWPHDNLHAHNGMNMQGLLYIEYGFHLTLMIAGLIIAKYFLKNTGFLKNL